MNTNHAAIGVAALLGAGLVVASCGGARAQTTQGATAADPPAAKVVTAPDANLFAVEHPDQFPLATAEERPTTSELVVTGTVTPDIARNVPVVSLASGRIIGIHTRLGDSVQQGQLLLTVRSDDVSSGYSNYRKALTDEQLARTQLDRAKELYARGAIAMKDLELAQDTEDKAKVDVETMAEHLRLLGNNPDKPDFLVNILAPVAGVITDQQVTNAAAIQAFGSPSPFTISDMSIIWIVCDVYEDDLSAVHMGDTADITLNAFPNRVFKGRVSNIGAMLDPNIRTAKVRIEVANPGIMRLGMFARATFHGQTMEMHSIVPAAAVLHMHDRDFVFVPAPGKMFRRVEVVGGDLLDNDKSQQEIKSGIDPGQQIVSNALVLDHVLAQ
jgi:cobalt-zinc-cadmium efflux system membrane fusion protein